MDTSDKIALAAIVISVISLLANGYLVKIAREANRLSHEANTSAREANQIAHEANTLGQTANSYASEANVVSHKSNDFASEALDISKKTYEAENVPQVSITVNIAFDFAGVVTLLAGSNYALRPPSAFVPPTPIMLATVKNERRIPVTIANAGLENPRTHAFIAFP